MTKSKKHYITIKQWISSPESEQAIREAIDSALKRTMDAEKEKQVNYEKAKKLFG